MAWAVAAAGAAALDDTLVVWGCVPVGPALDDELRARVTLLENAAWSDGLATSLQVAVAAAGAAGHDAVVVGLGDQPLVPAAAWVAVASAPAAPVVVATYGGRRRNPVRLDAAVWPLLPEAGDEGARHLLRERPDLVAEVACPGEPADVDTVEDLAQWS